MARELQPCGTAAAARRHRRRNEPLCEACQQAVRDEKNERVTAKRREAAQAAQDARPAPAKFDRRAILEEVLENLRGQLVEAPPQSVAGIAKQIRDTASELAELDGEKKASSVAGGGVNDIAARRAEREARRRAAAQG